MSKTQVLVACGIHVNRDLQNAAAPRLWLNGDQKVEGLAVGCRMSNEFGGDGFTGVVDARICEVRDE